MRAEAAIVKANIEAIKSAGRHAAARLCVLINTMETEGHLATRPISEEWELAEPFLDDLSRSPHFTKKHGDDSDACTLFLAAAKLEFFGILNLRENSRAVTNAEDSYYDWHWERFKEEREADERAIARSA